MRTLHRAAPITGIAILALFATLAAIASLQRDNTYTTHAQSSASPTSTDIPTPAGAPVKPDDFRLNPRPSFRVAPLQIIFPVGHTATSYQYRWRRQGLHTWSSATAVPSPAIFSGRIVNFNMSTGTLYHQEGIQVQARGVNSSGGGAWSKIVTYKVQNASKALFNPSVPRDTVSSRALSIKVKLSGALPGTIKWVSSNTKIVTVNPASLTFTADNYNTEQTFTINTHASGNVTIHVSFTLTGASTPSISSGGAYDFSFQVIGLPPPPADTPTPDPSASATSTPTATNTPAPTDTPTNTPSPTATNTPAPTDTPTATATNTPAPTDTPTATATNTPAPTATATNTPAPTDTDTPTATATNTPAPTDTHTPTHNQHPSSYKHSYCY